jgi:hypothetical protein
MFDTSKHWRDYSVFTPALQRHDTTFAFGQHKDAVLPANLKPRDIDVLYPETKLLRLPQALHSAGIVMANEPYRLRDDMDEAIGLRDRLSNFILGDSGGFQVATRGLLVTNDLRMLVKLWIERWCDGGLPVDVPTAAIYNPGSLYFGKFKLALDHTAESHEFWECHFESDSGTMRFVVFQGHTPQQAAVWYNAMKKYRWPGVAWGGAMRKNCAHVLRRLLEMDRDGLLQNVRHIHFLGIAGLGFAVVLTSLKRALSKRLGHEVKVTFDVATHAIHGRKLLQVIKAGINWRTLSLNVRRLEAASMPNDADVAAPLMGSELGRLGLTMRDLRRNPHPNTLGWDEVGRTLLVNHNLEMMCRAIIEANQHADLDDALSQGMPEDIRIVRQVIHEVLVDGRGEQHIAKWAGPLGRFAEKHAFSDEER